MSEKHWKLQSPGGRCGAEGHTAIYRSMIQVSQPGKEFVPRLRRTGPSAIEVTGERRRRPFSHAGRAKDPGCAQPRELRDVGPETEILDNEPNGMSPRVEAASPRSQGLPGTGGLLAPGVFQGRAAASRRGAVFDRP